MAKMKFMNLSAERERELVERAVRATIEACAGRLSFDELKTRVRTTDPAPIVARVLGGWGVSDTHCLHGIRFDDCVRCVAPSRIESLRAEVRDLKARLAYVRRRDCTVGEMKRATDLRRKGWKP